MKTFTLISVTSPRAPCSSPRRPHSPGLFRLFPCLSRTFQAWEQKLSLESLEGWEKPRLAAVDKVGTGALGAEQIALEGQPSSSVPQELQHRLGRRGSEDSSALAASTAQSQRRQTARRAGCLECRKQETGEEQSWGPSGSCLLACGGRTMRLHPGLLFAFL